MTGKNHNSGNYNSGHQNSGNYNSGNCNSGNCNSGYHNSGDDNSGNYNSGYHNSGYRNSGHHNAGHQNSGDHNSGDYNSGDYNSGDHNSGDFNTNEPTIRLFNKDTGKLRGDVDLPYIYLPLNTWISWSDMSSSERKEHTKAEATEGMLITLTYKEAWIKAWSEAPNKLRRRFLDLPNFDVAVFKEITGVDVENADKVEIKVDGKVVYISRDSAIALNLIKETIR
jgi:hypothetical protein